MKCPKYGYEVTDELKRSYCLNCSDKCDFIERGKPLGEVNMFELGRLMKEKREKEQGGQ